MSAITVKQLLEAGAHFGHQTNRWNPKMKKYIFGARNGIYIIDLQQTVQKFADATKFVKNEAAKGSTFLFIGTKRQAQELVSQEAKRCGMFFINQRWLGGTLTNFQTIQKSIARLREISDMKESGLFDVLPKREVIGLEKEMEKLLKNLGGITEMNRLPDVVIVIDPKKERIALNEVAKLGITSVAMVDTNCDPQGIDYIIPANDDSIRSMRLVIGSLTDAIIDGRKVYEADRERRKAEDEKKRAEQEAIRAAAKKEAAERKARESAASGAVSADDQDLDEQVEAKYGHLAAEEE